ncbi:MAG: sterol desaturase family protein [Ginsengibacter sp.]
MIRSIFDIYGTSILVLLFVILFIFESKYQLRKRVQSRWKRAIINFLVALPSFALLRLVFISLMVWLAYQNEQWHFGLNYLYVAPGWLKASIVFFLLDYSNYLWHIILHRMPLMWRFHLVHHTDLDLDITTSFRFHFGELIGSFLFRGAAVLLLGVSPLIVLIYEIAFEASNQFQHSNIKIPFRFEKVLNTIFVTPRMHGIHHSMKKRETDSNFSIIFPFWDRLHRTIKLNVPQDKIRTGVPCYPDEKELTTRKLLKLPFTKIREWKKPE